ncbi:DUF4145 domain-containing protein [Ornithinibacillus halotolerans]|uniref:DUF4145 domain-containing protein n=1 Tax=Ornithinibacillus halotolerans TaxID=1274357 RepID=A0A916SBL5_9BACI|nr:DUF4145 domain-containing protein [Ornithinibacillus halotolerans]GGA91681.1 hypothetical protein GCM10008025_37700 [Ornithinibacillus halotolerans]
MTNSLGGSWYSSIVTFKRVSYKCGYCGKAAGPSSGYKCQSNDGKNTFAYIYICPNCNKPTFKKYSSDEQVPGELFGNNIEFLPNDIEQLYNEARNCISVNAFTSAVLSCRKMLMNISVSQGAEAGKSFAYYVDYLEENYYIPPNSREWVDIIRKKGNEATHEIPSISKDDAVELLEFTEMLLRFVYELPGKMIKYKKK